MYIESHTTYQLDYIYYLCIINTAHRAPKKSLVQQLWRIYKWVATPTPWKTENFFIFMLESGVPN